MKFGLGITLLVVGAIIAFAVQDRVSGINLTYVGYILMAGGAAALVFGAISAAPRKSNTSTTVQHSDGTMTTQRTDSVVDDRPVE